MPAPTHGRFERTIRIRFAHCDPAGIVFYPQYLVLLTALIEDWVDTPADQGGLGLGYADVIGRRRVGLPTVRLECDFRAVSRLGEDVVFGLEVEQLSSRSLTLAIDVRGPGAARPAESPSTASAAAPAAAPASAGVRMQARVVLVTTSLDHHGAIPLPDDLRAAVRAFRPRDRVGAAQAATIPPDTPNPDARSPA